MKEKQQKKAKNSTGFGLRLSFAIILTVLTVGFIVAIILTFSEVDEGVTRILLCSIAAFVAVVSALQMLAAIKGKTKKWANVISIVIGAVFVCLYLLGILAIVGGVRGNRAINVAEESARNAESVNAGVSAQTAAEGAPRVKEAGQNERRSTDGANDVSLRIISIPDKEWKEYRDGAPQDELLVLGIGMKLWLAKTRVITFCFTLGLLLSVIVGLLVALLANVIAGVIILALGYLVFCTLCIRRRFVKNSLEQARRKLSADNKKALDAEFKPSGGAAFADGFSSVVLLILSEPYYLALALVAAVLPSVLETKLVIPEGFGFETLEQVKGYYTEKSFLSEALESCISYQKEFGSSTSETATSSSPTEEYYKKVKYTYTDDYGYEQTVYSDDGKNFYDEGGNCVGGAVDEKTVEIRGKIYNAKKEN